MKYLEKRKILSLKQEQMAFGQESYVKINYKNQKYTNGKLIY